MQSRTSTDNTARQPVINAELILPLRLFLGGMFLYAGIQKLTAATFFSDTAPGSIGEQLRGFLQDGTPLAFLIRHVALPHAVLIGALVALAELWVGLSTLTGLLPRAGAIGGAGLSLLFFLTTSWNVRPIFLGQDLPYLAAWITLALTGPGPYTAGELFRRVFPVEAPAPAAAAANPGSAATATMGATLLPRSKFLRDLWAAAILATASIGLAGFINRDQVKGGDTKDDETTSVVASPTLTADQIAPDDRPPAGGVFVTNMSTLATNRSQEYTDPGSGDPALLIHLADNRLVAFDGVCTHAGCGVEYDPAEKLIICPCHGATFDPAKQAAVVFGPAPRALTPRRVKVLANGDVYAVET